MALDGRGRAIMAEVCAPVDKRWDRSPTTRPTTEWRPQRLPDPRGRLPQASAGETVRRLRVVR